MAAAASGSKARSTSSLWSRARTRAATAATARVWARSARSTARTRPNRNTVRSAVKPRVLDISTTPTEKNEVSRMARAASFPTRRWLPRMVSSTAVSTPKARAPASRERPSRWAITIPGNTVWVRASPTKARRRSTTSTPTAPARAPSTSTSTRARCMYGRVNGWKRFTASRPGDDDPVAAELEGLAAVGGPQQLGGEGGADRPEADLVAVEQADLVAGEVGQAEVVGGHDHRRPAGPQPAQGGQEQVLGEGVDPVEGLVEQQQPRLLGDRPGQQDPLALAAGEGPEPGGGPLGQPDLGQGLLGGLAVGRPGPAQPADPRVAAHQHHLEGRDRELGVEGVGLGHVGDLAPGRRGRPAQHLDGPRGERDQAEDGPDEGRLAGPVGADEGDRLAGRDLPVDPLDHRVALVGDGGPPQDEDGVRRH